MSFTAPVTVPAFGHVLKRAGTAIAQVIKINGHGVEMKGRKTTHLSSTWQSERPVTVPKGLPITFEVLYHPTTHAGLNAACIAGTEETYSLVYPPDDAATPTTPTPTSFKAFVSKVEQTGIEEDGTLQASLTLTPTGEVTL
jgi:hypothetical protein